VQELPGKLRDLVRLLVQGEVAGVEEVDLGVGHVPAVRLRLGGQEGRVAAGWKESASRSSGSHIREEDGKPCSRRIVGAPGGPASR